MKERGILFRDRLVRRILNRVNPKTQTRRIVKTSRAFADWDAAPKDAYDVIISKDGFASFLVAGDHGYTDPIPCPYGAPGDRLWVREAWRSWSESHHDHHADDEDCDEHCRQVYVAYRSTPRVGFRPTPDRAAIAYLDESTPLDRNPNLLGPWKPGIHLRRDHARIVLDVTKVRVERLQDISEADSIAEGVERTEKGWLTTTHLGTFGYAESARLAFAQLWRFVNGPDSWEANPWVWVVEFKRTEARSIGELIHRSSIGAGLQNIRENGIDAELADLEREMSPRRRR